MTHWLLLRFSIILLFERWVSNWLNKRISEAQCKERFTTRFGPTDHIAMTSAKVKNGCMTSQAAWGPSADNSRVQLHWSLCRRSWSASDWQEAFESQRAFGSASTLASHHQQNCHSKIDLCIALVLLFSYIISYNSYMYVQIMICKNEKVLEPLIC